ncbi:MAG: BglG family transcription antiterminator [[Lactobacillus] timonensis]|jgi:transcriptional antiterminator/mannitol/fructose-specific phosphotransferase system IIA component (Ntr-type)|nr:BglG family transcription antiterminator [[Lactobacillus] timonensis]
MIDLSEKEKTILILLLDAEEPLSVDELTEKLAISKRSVYSVIAKLNKKLLDDGITPLQNVRGVGYHLIDDSRSQLGKLKLQDNYRPRLKSVDREQLMIWELFLRERSITISYLEQKTAHSRSTILKDIDHVRTLLKSTGIELIGNRNGYSLVGDELQIRNYVFKNINFQRLIAVFRKTNYKSPTWQQYDKTTEWLTLVQKFLHHYFSYESFRNISFFYSGVISRLRQGLSLSVNSFPSNEFIKNQMHDQPEFEFARDLIQKIVPGSLPEETYYLEGLLLESPTVSTRKQLGENDIERKTRQATVEVINTFKNLDQVKFQDEKKLQSKLFQHLIATFYRVAYHRQYKDKIAGKLKKQYRQIYLYTQLSLKPFEDLLAEPLNDDEVGLISMYFGAELYHQHVQKQSALLVCSAGLGTSYLLKSQLETMIPELLQVGPITKSDYEGLTEVEQDIVISTVPVSTLNKPVIKVDSILSDNDLLILKKKLIRNHIIPTGISQNLSAILEVVQANTKITNYRDLVMGIQDVLTPSVNYRHKGEYGPLLSELLTDKTIQIGVPSSGMTWQQAIQRAAQPLIDLGKIKSSYVDDIIANVHKNGPYINIADKIALAHAQPSSDVLEVGMSLLLLDNTVDLVDDKHKIQLIVVLAAKDSSSHLRALAELTQILGDEEKVKQVLNAKSVDTITQLIRDGE